MAIVKMRRLRLFGMAADRGRLLEELQRLGCVEIDEPTEKLSDPQWAALVRRPDGGALTALREQRAGVEAALDTLKHYAPAKGGLLKARPVITEAQLFDPALRDRALAAAAALNEAQRRVGAIYAEQGKTANQLAALRPWLELDLPLDTPSTREVTVTFGTLPSSAVRNEVEGALAEATKLAALNWAGADRETQYLVLFSHRAEEERAMEVLKGFGFSKTGFQGWKGTAQENTQQLELRQAGLIKELETVQADLATRGGDREDLKRCRDRLDQEIFREEAKQRLLDTKAAYFLEGWVPVPELGRLDAILQRYICSYETEDPVVEDYPRVPVQLKNNALTRPLNMVTEMYSLPAYDGIDPNPLIAPFFILFYGIMMADMGYGLLMMIASVVVLKTMRPKGGMNHFFSLMGLCGVSVFIVGALTGGFFGDMIPQLLKMMDPASTFVWFWPPLFTPLDDTLMILIGSMILGFIQINTGMLISFVRKLRAGEVMDAIWEEGTWWIVFLGGGLAILGVTPLVLALGGVMILVGAGWTAKGFGKVSAVLGSLYNHVTGYFGDILSYSRLMALMLAGSVIAQVFNTLGAIPGNIIIFFVISLAGNALNFALNLLGCYVHDLRLQCLEYFGKFYKDGGKPFRPLEHKTKFVDLAE